MRLVHIREMEKIYCVVYAPRFCHWSLKMWFNMVVFVISRPGGKGFFYCSFTDEHTSCVRYEYFSKISHDLDFFLSLFFFFVKKKNEKRQLWVRPIEKLKLNFASCVVHQTRSLGVLILCFFYHGVRENKNTEWNALFFVIISSRLRHVSSWLQRRWLTLKSITQE